VCAHELRSLCGDRLFKSALRSLMISRKRVILLERVACQAFGGVSSTVGRRLFTDSQLFGYFLLHDFQQKRAT
jgi:hypothetical protein